MNRPRQPGNFAAFTTFSGQVRSPSPHGQEQAILFAGIRTGTRRTTIRPDMLPEFRQTEYGGIPPAVRNGE